MLYLFVIQIVSQTLFLFAKLSYLELGLFVQSNEFHVQVTYFVLFLLTILFEFSDLEFVFLVVVEMVSFDGLNLHVIFVLQLADLHILHVLYVCDVFLKFLDFVDKSSVL